MAFPQPAFLQALQNLFVDVIPAFVTKQCKPEVFLHGNPPCLADYGHPQPVEWAVNPSTATVQKELYSIVTLTATLVVTSGSAPKPSDAPESPSHMPVLKLTVCGLPGSLSLMTRVADRAPAAVGLNARLIVQLPSPATVLPTAQVELA